MRSTRQFSFSAYPSEPSVPPRQSSVQITDAAMPASRSACATRRTFAEPNSASTHGAKMVSGGRAGLPVHAISWPKASRELSPTNTCRSSRRSHAS